MTGSPDIVVVGAGASGLLAALAASRIGRRVTLLDGGDGMRSNLAISGGLIAAADTPWQADAGIADDATLWQSDIETATLHTRDALVSALVTRHAERALRLIAASIDQPVEVIDDIIFPGHSVARMHQIGGYDGAGLAAALLEAARMTPAITLRLHTPVTGLHMRGDRVAGVQLGGSARADVIDASAVVLATGGFGGNRHMVRRHMPELCDAPYLGSANNDGVGMGWAVALGAPLRDMGGYQGHGHATLVHNGRLAAGVTTVGAIIVDQAGRRFVREDIGPSGLAAHVVRCEGGAVEILTDDMHDAFLRFSSYQDAVDAGVVQRFETLEALAASFDLPAKALRQTLVDFNRSAQGDQADPFGRLAFGGPIHPPYRAVRITAALVHTQGGLTVDDRAAILGTDDRPITGLFGGGGCVVGLTGNSPAGYLPGHGLAQSTTLGMLAGESAARAALP